MSAVDTNGPVSKVGGVMGSAADSQLLHSSLLAMAQGNADGAGNGPPGLSTTPTLTGLVNGIKRRWAIALGVALTLTTLAVAGVFYFHPPKYLVTMELRIVAKQAGPDDPEYPIFKASMETMVKNSIVLSNALNAKTVDGRDIKDLEIVRSKGLGAVGWLRKTLKTDYLLGPEILKVTLPADQPEEAAELLNAIGNAFLAEYAEMERAKKQARLTDLRAKKDELVRDVNSLRAARDRMIKAMDIKDINEANVQQQQWISDLSAAKSIKRNLDEEVAKAEGDILSNQARLKNIDQQQIPDEVLQESFSRDDTVRDFQKRLGELDRIIAKIEVASAGPEIALRESETYRHEKAKIIKTKKDHEAELRPAIEAKLRKQYAEQLKYQITVDEEKIENWKRRRTQLTKDIAELDRKVKETGVGQNRPAPIAAADEKIELAQMALKNTAQRISDVELEPIVPRVLLVQRPSPPQEKDKSQQTKIAGAGGMGVFLLALFGVGFYEFRSRKIGASDEIAHGLGLNVVGTIPTMPMRSRKPSAKDAHREERWHAQLQEAVDAIRTFILHQARLEAMHVIMISSARSGEGKTTLATQLAASLARAWKRTLVIDADLRHPGAHLLFDTPQEPGLAEVLRGEVEPADAIRATQVSRLWMLPAGNGDAHAIQALAQDNLRTLFEQLKQQYDFIIIDTPPVLPVTDSLLIGQHVDGVLYAVLRDVSRAPAVYAAQQKLAQLAVHTIGAVLLGAETDFGDKTYGYAMNQTK
jgi:capsular exopolysaccharide synthesis family protein